MPSTDETRELTFDKFTVFPKLPIELRLAIWGFAVPEPAVIKQRISNVNGRRFHFARSVPAVLHACQESRYEYLEGGNDETLERRRCAHPVYKLQFRNWSGMSAGAYMSTEIDSFWGMRYNGSSKYRKSLDSDSVNAMRWSMYTGIAELCEKLGLGSTLKHLVLTYNAFYYLEIRDILLLATAFPHLASVSFIIPDEVARYNMGSPALTYKPEIDGALDDSHMQDATTRPYCLQRADAIPLILDFIKQHHPKLKLPVIKLRFEKQFIENENLTWPGGSQDAAASA